MIYPIIYLVVAALAIIITNNLVYIDHIKNRSGFNRDDEYVTATLFSLMWPGVILSLIVVGGSNFLWEYILFPLLTIPGRLYLKYKKE